MAFRKCFSKLGISVEIPLLILGFVVWYFLSLPTWDEIVMGDYVIGLYILFGFFLFVFLIFLVWELQAVFPTRITVEKINSIEDVSIKIDNGDVVDFEEISVEIERIVQIYSNGAKIEDQNPPNARTFDDEGGKTIGYESSRTIRIASKKDAQLTLCLQTPRSWGSWETSHNGEKSNAVIGIDLIIKGKIKGRPIFPKKISGEIVYFHQPTVVDIPIGDGKFEKRNSYYSKITWDKLL